MDGRLQPLAERHAERANETIRDQTAGRRQRTSGDPHAQPTFRPEPVGLATQRSREHHNHAAQTCWSRPSAAPWPAACRRRWACLIAGGSWLAGPGVATVQPGSHPLNSAADRSEEDHVQMRFMLPGPGGHRGGHGSRPDRHRPGPAPDAVEQFRRGERASQQDNTPADAVDAGESAAASVLGGVTAAEGQTAAGRHRPAAASSGAVLHPQRDARPGARPGAQPDQPSGEPTRSSSAWGLAALAVVAGLALLAARRANRQVEGLGAGGLTTATHSMGLPRPPAAPSPCRRRLPADRNTPSWAALRGDMVG